MFQNNSQGIMLFGFTYKQQLSNKWNRCAQLQIALTQ